MVSNTRHTEFFWAEGLPVSSVYRCLGDPQFKENDKDVVDCTPEMRRVELQRGDFAIVLASDGLWDVLSDTELVTILQKVSPVA